MHYPFCVMHPPSRVNALSTPFVSAGFVHARLPHLASVFAAMAVSHHAEHQTGWGIKRFVATTRRYRTEKFGRAARSSPLPTHYPTTSVMMSWPKSATPLH
jgi:hypothetical protein